MATNYVGPGAVLDYTNAGSAISSGDVVVMGSTVGIALVDIATGATGAVATEGIFTVAKVAGTAWAVGDKLDWDASESAFGKGITAAAGDVVGAGIAGAVAGSAATTGQIKLLGGALGATVT
ncbi:MAG: DUF2190 family protein [Methyloceanibacter sp.]|nr:DUF2190 family protein [Methyloceanibacter sp.]